MNYDTFQQKIFCFLLNYIYLTDIITGYILALEVV